VGFVGEVADDCAVDGVNGGWMALEDDCRAGLRIGGSTYYDETTASAIGGLAVSEPCGEGNASGVLDGFVG
jgi:hypothetical protein